MSTSLVLLLLLPIKITLVFILINSRCCSTANNNDDQLAPALFVFGDSLLDVGNNNYLLLSNARADFPHYGVDFPTHNPTGRFSNGKNAADFLADKLGLPSPPPYLSSTYSNNYINYSSGVSFASGGAGFFDDPNERFQQSIAFYKQVEYYWNNVYRIIVEIWGYEEARKLLSKSVFVVEMGVNDIMRYFGKPSLGQQPATPQQLVASMLLQFKAELEMIYKFGGRKFVVFNVAAIGCCPSQRVKNLREECNEVANIWANIYNEKLQSLLQDYQTKYIDFQYSYFNTHAIFLDLIRQPAAYGFMEANAACCGMGRLNAEVGCIPESSYCSNRSDHVFWDPYHPSEAAARILVETAFDGPKNYAFPVNVRQLVSV